MTPQIFKILTGCLILLIPISGAIAVYTNKSQFNATSSTSSDLVARTKETSQPENPKLLASEPDSEGCPVCMEDASDWSNRNLQRANFWSSSLQEANFSRSDLTGANFKDANLTGANFRNANLRNADFSKANLSHADLTGAQLQGANLQDAILFEAKLQNANFQGANLTGAVLPRGFNALNSSAIDSRAPEFAPATATDAQTVAREATVLIGHSSKGGSGVIIARSGNTYYVATAEHVIDQLEQYGLQTYDGEQHTLTVNAVRKLPGVDLAILQFTSHKNYRIVRLVNSDLISGIEATSVYIAGYPLSSDKQPRRYRFSSGRVIDNSPGDMAEGYSLFYTNTTLGGMSGSPILDWNGRLVGIHGRGFTEEMNDESGVLLPVRYEVSLGIPINTLLQLTAQIGINLPVQVDRNASRSRLQTESELSPEVSTSDTGIRKVVHLCNQGFDLLLSNQPQAALSAFSEAIELHPDSHLPWYGKAQALQALGNTQEALAALDRTLQQEPSFYLALLAKGYILRELQQYPTAIAVYNQIINDQNPSEPDVHSFFQSKAFYWRGATQYDLGNTQGAIADYGEAIRLNPYFARAHYQRGSVYLELKNKPAAIRDFEQAASSYKAQGNMAGYHNTQQIMSFLKR
jgi:uncharacterized protein YjbI with pentapeptide repeats/Flp pilus assembly protein TadD